MADVVVYIYIYIYSRFVKLFYINSAVQRGHENNATDDFIFSNTAIAIKTDPDVDEFRSQRCLIVKHEKRERLAHAVVPP